MISPSWVATVLSVGVDALEAVEDLVVLGAARGEHGDDVLDPAAADVGDVGLHVRAGRAGPGRPADALLV